MQFIKNNLEKSKRLIQILEFINTDKSLKGKLALKGGTAINQLFFDFPRISYDIDLDYVECSKKDEILIIKNTIEKIIIQYMLNNNYQLNLKSRKNHILTSMIFSYTAESGSKDNIKLDINYINRFHIFPLQYKKIENRVFKSNIEILTLATEELFGSKLNALVDRTTARDLYDIYTLFTSNTQLDYDQMVNSYIFYNLLITQTNPIKLNYDFLNKITNKKYKTQLKPLLSFDDSFDLDKAKTLVQEKLKILITENPNRKVYIQNFINGIYTPDILFSADTTKRIINHPMVLWKISHYKK